MAAPKKPRTTSLRKKKVAAPVPESNGIAQALPTTEASPVTEAPRMTEASPTTEASPMAEAPPIPEASRVMPPAPVDTPATTNGHNGLSFTAVQQRAYELFIRRGAQHGHDLSDWFTAEHELKAWHAPPR